MIEMCSKFLKPEMLERLAKSLDIEAHDFFKVDPSPQDELEKLRQVGRLPVALLYDFCVAHVPFRVTVKKALLID